MALSTLESECDSLDTLEARWEDHCEGVLTHRGTVGFGRMLPLIHGRQGDTISKYSDLYIYIYIHI